MLHLLSGMHSSFLYRSTANREASLQLRPPRVALTLDLFSPRQKRDTRQCGGDPSDVTGGGGFVSLSGYLEVRATPRGRSSSSRLRLRRARTRVVLNTSNGSLEFRDPTTIPPTTGNGGSPLPFVPPRPNYRCRLSRADSSRTCQLDISVDTCPAHAARSSDCGFSVSYRAPSLSARLFINRARPVYYT